MSLPDGLSVEIAAPRRTNDDPQCHGNYRVTRYDKSLGTFVRINDVADYLDRLTHDAPWRWEPPAGSLPALQTSLDPPGQAIDADGLSRDA